MNVLYTNGLAASIEIANSLNSLGHYIWVFQRIFRIVEAKPLKMHKYAPISYVFY